MDLSKDTQKENIWITYLALKYFHISAFLSDGTYHWNIDLIRKYIC